ncbi:MAG: hypothetical protein ABSH52_34595 [Terriglobia bacterium]|jgi:hypothetical protein
MERYGVFKRFPNGSRLWVCPANDLTEARTKMLDSARKTGHEHFIRDFVLGQTVATSREKEMAVGQRTEET